MRHGAVSIVGTNPVDFWPGWSRDRRFASFVVSGILWLAAIHPGRFVFAATHHDPTAGPRPGYRAVSLDDLPVEPGARVDIGPIEPRQLEFRPAPPVPTLQEADQAGWIPVPTDSGAGPMFLYWPDNPGRSTRVSWSAGPVRPRVSPGMPADAASVAGVLVEREEEGEPAEARHDAGDEDSQDDESADPRTPSLPPWVHLTEPAGRARLVCDSTVVIRWNATDESDVDRVRLEFSTDGGRRWIRLADSLDNSGEWEWVVPWTETRHGRLRVIAHDDSGMAGIDASDHSFTIRRPAWMAAAGLTRGTVSLEGPTINPVGAVCRFMLGMPESGVAELVILAVTGRLVTRLWSGIDGPGRRTIEWDGRDAAGRPVASGVYFVRLTALGSRIVRRLVLRRGRSSPGPVPSCRERDRLLLSVPEARHPARASVRARSLEFH